MRTNLSVPHAEKDSAKKLGARWDVKRRAWYVKDVEDLTLFMKWLPARLLKPSGHAGARAKPTRNDN